MYDCYTSPENRGGAVYPAALSWALRHFRSIGVERAYIRVHKKNTASIRGIGKAGFRFVGVAHHVRLLGIPLRPWGTSGARARRRIP